MDANTINMLKRHHPGIMHGLCSTLKDCGACGSDDVEAGDAPCSGCCPYTHLADGEDIWDVTEGAFSMVPYAGPYTGFMQDQVKRMASENGYRMSITDGSWVFTKNAASYTIVKEDAAGGPRYRILLQDGTDATDGITGRLAQEVLAEAYRAQGMPLN